MGRKAGTSAGRGNQNASVAQLSSTSNKSGANAISISTALYSNVNTNLPAPIRSIAELTTSANDMLYITAPNVYATTSLTLYLTDEVHVPL